MIYEMCLVAGMDPLLWEGSPCPHHWLQYRMVERPRLTELAWNSGDGNAPASDDDGGDSGGGGGGGEGDGDGDGDDGDDATANDDDDDDDVPGTRWLQLKRKSTSRLQQTLLTLQTCTWTTTLTMKIGCARKYPTGLQVCLLFLCLTEVPLVHTTDSWLSCPPRPHRVGHFLFIYFFYYRVYIAC